MANDTSVKAAQLGMPWGTANNRLRKSIMFKYIKMAGDDICFRCEKVIERIEDLSIEHKLSWQGVSTQLYWDLDNIAFSHLSCNTGPTRFMGS